MKPLVFDPKILSRIKSLELRAKFIVEGFLIGIHRSPYHGFSVEFAEHRPYQPGDEPKKVDWKLYARSERLYTKEFEEETNMLVYIILDVSNSMNYSSEGITKYEYAATVGASLAYLLIHQKDAVSLTLFDKEIRLHLPPSATKLQFIRMIKVLESTTPSEQTQIPEVLDIIGVKIKKKGMVIFISDLLPGEPVYDNLAVIKALKDIRYRNNEVIVFHILDPAEINLPFTESAILKDMETLSELPVTPDIRGSYKYRVQEFISGYKKAFRSHNIDYLLLPTSDAIEKSLVFYLARRKKMNF